MAALPKITKQPIPTSQREFLRQWLEQQKTWRAADALAEAIFSDVGSELGDLSHLAQPVDAEGQLHKGSVILLHPELTPDANRPVYLALLSQWEEAVWLCAPFARTTVPALPAELKTGREEEPLAVLQLWNAHSLPEALIAKAWFIDELSAQEQADAWAVLRTQFGAQLPESLQDRIGPPIFVSEDPRITYQREEIQAMSDLRRLATEFLATRQATITEFPTFDEATTNRVIAFAFERQWDLPLAAADQDIRHSVSWARAIELASDDTPSADLPPPPDHYYAVMLDAPQLNEDQPGCGLISWRLVPAIRPAVRAWILDLSAGLIVGTAEVFEDGGLVFADKVSWQRLEPYAEDAERLRSLHLLIEIHD